MPLVGGRADAAAIYPHRLCFAMCQGIAAQIAEDDSSTRFTKALNKGRLLSLAAMAKSLSLLCCEATGGYPPGIVDGSAFDLRGISMEVDGKEQPTGRFRKRRPAGISKPAGSWPEHWVDPIHDFDGHGVRVEGKDRTGKEFLLNEVNTLYVQHGIETAVDDVNGSWLDPAAVKRGRDVK